MENLHSTAQKYGWSFDYVNNQVLNKVGKVVVSLSFKKGRYQFRDTANNLIMSGSKNVSESLEKILISYYFCKPL